MLLISIATFMLLLDITVVNVALPDIQRDLNASLSSLQWVVDAYSLTAGRVPADRRIARRPPRPPAGLLARVRRLHRRLVPLRHRRRPDPANLARALQGVGGAAMFATSLALIGQEFHGSDRATAFGVWGATIGGAVAIGPLVGGAASPSTSAGSGSSSSTSRSVSSRSPWSSDAWPTSPPRTRSRSTCPASLTFSLSLFLLIFGLIRGNPEGWGSPLILACLIGAAALLAAFVAIEHRSSHPMLDLSLFRKPAFNGVSAVAFCLSAGMFALFLYLTIYLQGVLGYEPLEAGSAVPAAQRALLRRRADRRPPWRADPGPGDPRHRPGHGRCRAAVDAGRRPGLGVDRAACRADRRRGRHRDHQPGDRLGRDRRGARRRSRGWARGSTRRSARSASPPASPRSARCSSRGSKQAGGSPAPAPRRGSARSSPRAAPRRRRRSPPPGPEPTWSTPRRSPSPARFNEILLIGGLSLLHRRGARICPDPLA